jgi:transposase
MSRSKKSNAYHIDIQTHRKNPYGLLRNSYREDGKVKKETICRFSGLSLEQLRAMQAAIQGKTMMKEDLKIIGSREYGASYACVALMKQLGLHTDIFSRASEPWVRSSMAMIAGRIVYKGSKLSLSHSGTYSALWEICGFEGNEKIDVDKQCYEAMDRLLEKQERIQKKLAEKHLREGALVMYDITSSYMEREYEQSEVVDFGYNRDKKRGHEQIVIGLLCAKNGCPIAVEVFRGNTKDETTVIDKINEIKGKYGVEKFIFVGDRGMVTQAQYERIDKETVKVISALNHGKIKELCDTGAIQTSLFDEKNIVEAIDGNIRYCLCKNPEMAKKERFTREKLLAKTAEELNKITESKRKTKHSKEVRIGKIISKWNMAKFVILSGSGDETTWKFDVVKIENEQQFDGCYVVFTDVSTEDMTAVETVENYKNLIQVEQAFRNMKTVQLELRPVFHRKDDRIKCHVFICMLAYYVMWNINQRLSPLFESDGEGSARRYSFDYVIETLKSIRYENVDILGQNSYLVTTPTAEQNQILDLLEVVL